MNVKCGNRIPNQTFSVMIAELDLVEQNCRGLALDATMAQVRRARALMSYHLNRKNGVTEEQVSHACLDVAGRLSDELGARLVYVLKDGREEFCRAFTPDQNPNEPNLTEQAWGVVFPSFPSTKYDVTEALKCYAFGRGTACVFHLMRVLERGLKVFADRFGIPSDHTNWHNIIEGIEKLFATWVLIRIARQIGRISRNSTLRLQAIL